MTGAVYDLGYRPYDGERGGRGASRAALFRASVRRALGWRRPWRQKVAPFTLLAIAVVPAIVNVGVRYLTRDTVASDLEFITYREYVGVSNALLVFVALTAPDIMCPDRRQRVLPLIFARPLTGVDYVVAKVGALATILFAFSFLPQVILFVGQMLVTNDGALTYARDNAEVMWQVPVAVGLQAVYYSVIGVALASLASRRITAGASIVGLFLVTSIVSAVLVGPQVTETRFEPAGPATTLAEGEVAPPFSFDDVGPGETVVVINRSEPSAAPLLNLFSLPLILRDLVFLGEVDPTHPMSGVANGGLYAVLVFLLVVAVASGTLLYRYREVER